MLEEEKLMDRSQTKWMRLFGVRRWVANPKHGAFLMAEGEGSGKSRAKITFTCEGDADAVRSFIQTTLGRRLERAFDDFSKTPKGSKIHGSYNELKFETLDE